MGIDDVKLSPALLAGLYAEVLVAPAGESGRLPLVALPHLGENRRKISFVLSVPGKELLTPSAAAFLEKILTACKYELNDLAVINTALYPATAAMIRRAFTPEKLLLSGISPEDLGIQGPGDLFHLFTWENVRVLCLPPLADLDQETPEARKLKRFLWPCLQQLFGL